jgi:hypothetical protein
MRNRLKIVFKASIVLLFVCIDIVYCVTFPKLLSKLIPIMNIELLCNICLSVLFGMLLMEICISLWRKINKL